MGIKDYIQEKLELGYRVFIRVRDDYYLVKNYSDENVYYNKEGKTVYSKYENIEAVALSSYIEEIN